MLLTTACRSQGEALEEEELQEEELLEDLLLNQQIKFIQNFSYFRIGIGYIRADLLLLSGLGFGKTSRNSSNETNSKIAKTGTEIRTAVVSFFNWEDPIALGESYIINLTQP